MASALDRDLFERLRDAPERLKDERKKDVEQLVKKRYELAQKRLSELISDNTTLPVVLSSIQIDGIKQTREDFLAKVFEPVMKKPYTLQTAMQELQKTADTLRRFDIFQPEISVYLDTVGGPSRDSDSTHPTSLKAIFQVHERSRFTLQTGTDIGNTEGSGHLHVTYRNIFGGAESLVGSASTGTRTRSSYNLTLQTPIQSNPDSIAYAEGFAQSRTNQHYASHDEDMRGIRVGASFLDKIGGKHELAYSAIRRELLNLTEKASPSVRASAGESIKSALHHIYTLDSRDHPLLPRSGSLLKATSELAGLGGGVSHLKYEVDTQIAATAAPQSAFPVTFTSSFRAGLLFPLAPSLLSSSGETDPRASLLPDRFKIGGPTTVRGFRENGLGPQADKDSVGGDIYVSAGASALFPLPNVDKDRPIRLQAWINGGRLVALQRTGIAGVKEAIGEDIMNGLPSIAAGFGLVYAHPAARFEVNVGLPLVLRKGEKPRKGLQFGVGINFM